MKSFTGFTLIEIIVVMLLIGIVMGFAVPRFTDLQDVHIKAQARRIAALFRYIYSEAVTTKKDYRVGFDLEGGKYWVERVDESGQFVEFADILMRKERLLDGITFADIIMPGEGKITRGEVFIRVFPQGIVDEFTIHIKNRKDNTITLMIDSWTGEMESYRGYVEREEL